MEIHPFGSTAAGHVNVMIDPLDVDGIVRDEPEACAPLFWGKDVRGVRIDLDRARASWSPTYCTLPGAAKRRGAC